METTVKVLDEVLDLGLRYQVLNWVLPQVLIVRLLDRAFVRSLVHVLGSRGSGP